MILACPVRRAYLEEAVPRSVPLHRGDYQRVQLLHEVDTRIPSERRRDGEPVSFTQFAGELGCRSSQRRRS